MNSPGFSRIWFLLFLVGLPPSELWAAKCLFVSSYHRGYAWSDGIERGLRATLAGRCEFRQFDMDTKRMRSLEAKRQAADQAKSLIEQWQPDVVITADDNAARYLIQPYYRDAALPFVFCGINWSGDEYGFPYSNVTGMVEVAPINAMVMKAKQLMPGARQVFYLGADTATEQKNRARLRKLTKAQGLSMASRLVSTRDAWTEAYRQAQADDILIIGSRAGIDDWNDEAVVKAIEPLTQKLSVTSHGWMMPVSMLGMTKVPEEQGIWAGKAALKILAGVKPERIPMANNRKWDFWVNERLLRTAGLQLPARIIQQAKKFQD